MYLLMNMIVRFQMSIFLNKQTKVINGFECFKLVMYYFDLEQNHI